MSRSRVQSKRWTFTCFDLSEEFWKIDDQRLVTWCEQDVEYMVFQEEECPDTHRHHWQGFVIFKKRKDLSWLQRRFPRGTHFETAKGTNEQNVAYCTKEESRVLGGLSVTIGNLPLATDRKKGELRRAAVETLEAMKDSYMSLRDVPSDILMCPGFLQAAKVISQDRSGPIRPDLKIITMIGPPASGKSWSLWSHYPDAGRCVVGNCGIWFANPSATVMAFEEFNGQIPLQTMLTLLDIYPLTVEVKGGMRPVMWQTVVITSNVPPHLWYKNEEEAPGKRSKALEALYDRIGYIWDGYIPVRTCGHYLEPCPMFSIDEMRNYFMRELNIIEGIEEEDQPDF